MWRLHAKPYSFETEIRSSDTQGYPLHISQVRRLGSLIQLARKSHDLDGRIVYTFPFPANIVDVVLALIDKQPALIATLAQFNNDNLYTLIEDFKKMDVQPVWINKLLAAYFIRCSDEDCVAFWRVAKEFQYVDGEKLAFRRLLYTGVQHVLSNTIHKHFFDISADNLVEILKDDNLNVRGTEWSVVDMIDLWVEADAENRRAAQPLLYSYVRKQGLCNRNEIAVSSPFKESFFNNDLPPRQNRDRLLYMGGWNIYSASAKQYLFDKSEDRWRLAAMPKLPRKLCGFVTVTVGSIVYVIGGYNRNEPTSAVYKLEVREGLSLEWVQRACLNQRRFSHAACVLRGVIYTAGGLELVNNGIQQALRHFECYDPNNNQWKTLRQMHAARSDLAMAAGNGRIYVAGGRSDHGVILSSVEMYHPDNDVWIDVVSLPEPRKAASLLFDGHSLLLAGGFIDVNTATNKVIRWSPNTFTWHNHSTLNLGRVKMAAIIYENQMFLIGGRTSASDVRGVSVIEVYDPIENRWMFDGKLRYPRQGGCLIIVPDSADLISPAIHGPRNRRSLSVQQTQTASPTIEESESDSSDIEQPRAEHSSQASTSEASTD